VKSTLILMSVIVFGLTGCKTTPDIPIQYPPGAPTITSGFHSWTSINGKSRRIAHQGIDIKGDVGQVILAVADGTVLEATVDECWGPTIAVDHGEEPDGKKIVALYGHVGDLLVADGDQIKRGQPIARLGDNQLKFRCMAGVRHLHFQIGREYREKDAKENYWGWGYFLHDGGWGVNPHLYWANGPHNVTCFEANKTYRAGSFTYPVPCG
jgi:murein DD-endopeptidase MepM/ murein hydrolase activator NlpD